MRNFNRDNKSGGWTRDKKFGGRDSRDRGSSGRYSSRPPMHKAICDECGKECEVPFKPTGDKPVFCSVCFENKGDAMSRRSGRRDSRRSSYDDKQMFKAVCDRCGNECEVPFRPRSGKPVFCSQCFEKRDSSKDKKTEGFTDQFEILNTKLDRILQALAPVVPIKSTQKEDVVKREKALKPKKVAKKTAAKKKTPKKKTVAKKAKTKKKK